MPTLTLEMTNLIRDVATVLGACLVTIVISELFIVVIRRGMG
jgi:hypothetical protein